MQISWPDFKNFSKEHMPAFISALILVLTIAGSFAFFFFKKPDYNNMQALLHAGDYDQLIEKGESLLHNNSSDIDLRNILAAAYLAKAVVTGNKGLWVKKAYDMLSASIKIADNPESERLIGYGYFLVDNYSLAESYYKKSSVLDPKNALVWSNLGQLYEIKGNFPKANSFYKRALSLDNRNELAVLAEIRALYRAKKYSEVRTKADGLISTTQDILTKASAEEILGLAYLLDKNYISAARHFQNAIDFNPSLPVALASYARTLLDQIYANPIMDKEKQTEKPKALTLRAIKINPNYSYAYAVLARIEALRGDKKNAKYYGEKVLEALPKDNLTTKEDKTVLQKSFSTTTPPISNIKIISVKKSERTATFGVKSIKEVK